MAVDVAIIEGGGANISSLRFALERLGVTSALTADADKIRAAKRVILPGVGAAEDAMEKLRAAGLDAVIPGLTQPLLGICLGMQLLFDGSEEDDAQCLGVIEGRARLFDAGDERPVPHMGWNSIRKNDSPALLEGIDSNAYFYFVHSYAVDVTPATIGITNYGRDFSAVVTQDNFCGTQFHPERSGKNGARLLHNFLTGVS
ncbi:MAG: imidazole glycerol phosphate synthase subunit HisH [Gammaproteobacteria bacterium]|jgi:glutamine amidotransferase|nr:imidazole glycerol phosphate synthase subunit HisH [Gammaproteobacteria bacterium]MDP6615929.1 imidazole glycerol phosphate synthase subunit HisH [Gammaproteobacteria bacterium]MDP6695032.1 imidazole glycerol phosphate synthase subunit HisH [Gammaproteobacteria bacterium]